MYSHSGREVNKKFTCFRGKKAEGEDDVFYQHDILLRKDSLNHAIKEMKIQEQGRVRKLQQEFKRCKQDTNNKNVQILQECITDYQKLIR